MKTDSPVYRSAARPALATAILLMVPLLAMQLTDEVVWSVGDFVVAGALLFGAGLTWELVSRKAGNVAFRAGAGVAVAAALLLVWLNLAVGLIGSENNPANLMYLGVLAVEIAGAAIARFRAQGMSRALFATALAQALVAAIALIFGLGGPSTPPAEILGANGLFVVLFAGSALLFRLAANEQPRAAAGSMG